MTYGKDGGPFTQFKWDLKPKWCLMRFKTTKV